MRICELFDTASKYTITAQSNKLFAVETTLANGKKYELECVKNALNVWDIQFTVNMSTEETKDGNELEVFGITMSALKEFIDKYQPDAISLSSKGASRTSLYTKFVSRYCRGMESVQMLISGATEFFIYKGKISVMETETNSGIRYTMPLFSRKIHIDVNYNGDIEISAVTAEFLKRGNAKITNLIMDTFSEMAPKIREIKVV